MGEGVAHGSVVEGRSQSEGTDRNAMGEVRQAKGSQRKPGQKAEELPTIQPSNTPGSYWRAEVIGEKEETAMVPSAT